MKTLGDTFSLEPWDWRYYQEKVKQARFDLDEQALRPYFKLDNVREGAFYVAQAALRADDHAAAGSADLPPRGQGVRGEGSRRHARRASTTPTTTRGRANASARGAARFRGTRMKDGARITPVVVNVCNFSRPAGDEPALLSLEEVSTLFHEFGHALNSLLSKTPYRGARRVPPRLRRSAVADHGELGARARGAGGLRETLQDGRGDSAPRSSRRSRRPRSSIRASPRSNTWRRRILDMDWHTLDARRAEGRDGVRATRRWRRLEMPSDDRAAVPQPVLQPHLRAGRRLRVRLLRLHLERGPRPGRVPGVPREGPVRPGDGARLPHDPREGRHRRSR